MKSKPIAFFDSGIGGTTILKEVIKLLPNEKYVYYPDSKNLPYGNKSKEELLKIVDNVIQELLKYNPKIIVCSCNTATTMVLDDMRKKYPDYIFVGTEPAIKPIHDYYADKNVLVLTTKGTGHSEKFQMLFNKYKTKKSKLIEAPLLAELIENEEDPYPYLKDLLAECKNIEVVVLGCTHFPLAKEALTKVLGNVTFVHGGSGIARQVKNLLITNDLPFNNDDFELKILGNEENIRKIENILKSDF